MAPRIVLVGLPGSGKSTIGRRLSHALNLPLNDSDQLIEQVYDGRSCGEIFSTLGEKDFRTVEADVIAEALKKNGILSLGGGAVVTKSTRELLKDHSVVFLDISVDEGVRRTSRTKTRPLLDVPNPREKYQHLYDTRRSLYQEVATYTVRCDAKDPRRVVTDILNQIEE
ncbi:shikimate kinase [Corynebacterium sp. 320]|uniref:Shikimate kinase n=1 Tax=Corynebacterium zhongnanshanii TaxID=2768834 RepID=A0ABQ6VG94_9CORY|nr:MULTISPECIES: shikimate kinase [Corynebacterium]KAB1503707.1 shikimate kinase [Corynebacterium sp. 320]KAB1553192.1 shikimate kinase [Corynebacterium sp. 321]KAB1553589.1 shikimate kinase [Corynebacterium sp. 319]KAB3523442.1 shikimate kinase [Corynebacterium zhongnanshanii]KAB3527843.1 shikimate kinase [Corynebacterium sp. 250]